MSLRWLHRRPLPPVEKGYVSGALLVVRVDNERLGGFDEGDFTHYEDIDLSTRAGEAGMTVVVGLGYQVRHLGRHAVGRSPDRLPTARLRSYASRRCLRGRGRRSTRGYCPGDRAQPVVAFALHAGLRSLAPLHVVEVAGRSVLRIAHVRLPGPPT